MIGGGVNSRIVTAKEKGQNWPVEATMCGRHCGHQVACLVDTLEAYIRHFTTYAQDNWYSLLPMVALHVTARPANATGLSPFLLTHGWEVNALELFGDSSSTVVAPGRNSPAAQGERIVNHLHQALEWAQASMAAAQEDYEHHANAHHTPTSVYKPRDKVWLSLRNIHTDRPSKKLDAQQAQFTVLEQVGSMGNKEYQLSWAYVMK
ncbi:hypothetical protein VTO42DRAFT_4595 [Malbranchea cinnamomea]